ncbi:hypothetical protein [Nostoc flagelliforme]|nr:hypothetical protein [Nostoc flagelliforme]
MRLRILRTLRAIWLLVASKQRTTGKLQLLTTAARVKEAHL